MSNTLRGQLLIAEDLTTSEEEGEVDDEYTAQQGPMRQAVSGQSISTLSSEGNLSEEEGNTSECSSCQPVELLSSLSNPDDCGPHRTPGIHRKRNPLPTISDMHSQTSRVNSEMGHTETTVW
ncbi:hypothetical protein MTO96_025675 [Rhipicephalus appendiculatus]